MTRPYWSLDLDALRAREEGLIAEGLEWETMLSRQAGGSAHLPEPYDWGDLPGREPPVWVLDGLPVGTPGHPETPMDPWMPSWTQQLSVRPASPLRYPNNPTGGMLLEGTALRGDTVAVSAARLLEGSNETHTEELLLVRPLRGGQLRLQYGDHKSNGRQLYGRQFGENLLFGYERSAGPRSWSVRATSGQSRVRVIGERRWLEDRDAIEARWRHDGAWLIEGAGSHAWERRTWEEIGRSWKRKNEVQSGLLRATAPGLGAALRPAAAVQLDAVRLRFFAPELASVDRRDLGPGFAAGFTGATNRWRYECSAGRSVPDARQGDFSALGDLEWRFQRGGYARAVATRAPRARLLPRLSNHLSTSVGQALVVPDRDTEPPLEILSTLELQLGRRDSLRWSARLIARASEIRHAVSAEGGYLDRFVPDGFEFLPASQLDRTLRVAALHAELSVPLPFSLRFEARSVLRRSDPGWREQFWMTPWEFRPRLYYRRALFAKQFDLELELRGLLTGGRATPFGELGRSDRYDGTARARIGDLLLFFQLLNLEDDLTAAASYDGGAMPLPLRSYQLGMTWAFRN